MTGDRILPLGLALLAACSVASAARCTARLNDANKAAVIAVFGGDLEEPARAVACDRLLRRE